MTARVLLSQPALGDAWEYRQLWELLTNDSVPRYAGPLRELANYRRAVEDLTVRMVDDYKKAGKTWEYIGEALGMSAQGASQLHKRAKARR